MNEAHTLRSLLVLAATTLFAITLTVYKFYVTNENRKLDAGGDRAREAMKYGVTQEQVDLGWRYLGY